MTEPFKVSLCICTYKRPAGIRALMGALNAQTFSNILFDVHITLVDNCPLSPAFASQAEAQGFSMWPLHYVHEDRQGLVNARNCSIDEAQQDADAYVFLDDDGVPRPDWLDNLCSVLRETGATAAQGQMQPLFEIPAEPWMLLTGSFGLPEFARASPLHFAATNNSIVDGQFLRQHNLRFDMAFNNTGGEDEDFYFRLRKLGGWIAGAPDAVIEETIPADRMTWEWISRRELRRGNTMAKVALLRRDRSTLRFFKGLGHIGLGSLRFAVASFQSETKRRNARLQVLRGWGTMLAYFKFDVEEYSESAMAQREQA